MSLRLRCDGCGLEAPTEEGSAWLLLTVQKGVAVDRRNVETGEPLHLIDDATAHACSPGCLPEAAKRANMNRSTRVVS